MTVSDGAVEFSAKTQCTSANVCLDQVQRLSSDERSTALIEGQDVDKDVNKTKVHRT